MPESDKKRAKLSSEADSDGHIPGTNSSSRLPLRGGRGEDASDGRIPNQVASFRRRPMAPRAGTRGFRPPEVLMRFPHQTVAVDIWASGVTLLCILSQRYPFFQSPDDLTALCEIASVCGSEQIQYVAAHVLQKIVSCPTFYKKCDWKALCESYVDTPGLCAD